ncbi:type 4a pilus biogenesis protein PilO [Legionella lytica]|uniref:Type 4a pilus biogenesis protein PilO n=1 Tax=Legionella lytica TaxID=96232 RepID=A0ABW8D9P3_9GAMM
MSRISLPELTLETMGQWPKSVKTGLLLGLSALIIVLGYSLVLHDNLASFTDLKAQEVELKAEFASKQRQVVNLEAYRHQLLKLKEQFTALIKYLPAENEFYGLLEEISKIGMASGLKFLLFAPQAEEVHGFYTLLPIKMSIEGDYFQLASFLSRIASMERIVTFHDFSIKGRLSPCNQPLCEEVLVMNVTAKIYRYRTQ